MDWQATQYTLLSDFVTEIANSFIPCHSVADPSVRPQRQLFRRLPHLVTLVTGAGVGQTLGELEGLELGLRHGWEEPVVSNLAKQQQLIVHRYSLCVNCSSLISSLVSSFSPIN
uniref:Uncharacterized protein n=1 Tax=Oryza nivara TaxID=4536 RepID=A0A0E0GYW1_ORYNI